MGIKPKIAFIEGDNLMGRLEELQEKGETFTHMDKGIALKDAKAQTISANAYLGSWGIVEALNKGEDIVVGGRLAVAASVRNDGQAKTLGEYLRAKIVEMPESIVIK